ncbi:hypothetical protein [Methanobacterium formicicum]|uniref:hypothetical protein n=1 Tax=Methanobacterium formicicum TaxID=2162 RepID=UPI0024930E88|nr:hypothetical protein [Methanobacterium formicicum]
MLKILFGRCPQVKTLDFLLSVSEGKFNKTQLANGSEISRPTLDNFIGDFAKYGLINKVENNYLMLNTESEIVKSFARANILLAKKEAEIQSELHVPQKVEYAEEELDKLMDDLFDEEDLTEDEDEYQEKIAEQEEILVNKKEYEQLLDFYHTNNIYDHSKMAKNIEKIISETTTDIIDKISDVVFDAEQKASGKLDEEFTVYSSLDSNSDRKTDYNLEENQGKVGSI